MGPALKVAAGLAGAGLATGVALTTGAVAEARVGFALRRHTVAALPPGSADITVLQLSDFHFLPGMRAKARWVRRLRAVDPDLVITTGDNMSSPAALDTVLGALEPFLDLPGAFVFGSNDYYGPSWKNPLRYLLPPAMRTDRDDPPVRELPAATLAAAMTASGWRDLRNRRAQLTVRGTRFELVGVDDPHIEADRFPTLGEKPAATVRLGLTHAPYSRTLDAFAAAGTDLVLAGHTHGGQVCLPGYGALVTNCDLPTWRANGLMGWPGDVPGGADTPVRPWPRLRAPVADLAASSTWVHISAGLGTSPYAPIRLFKRPEANLLTLTARDADVAQRTPA